MGPWAIAAILAVALLRNKESRSHLKKAAIITLRTGYRIKDSCDEMIDKAKDYSEGLIAEVKTERDSIMLIDRKKAARAKAH